MAYHSPMLGSVVVASMMVGSAVVVVDMYPVGVGRLVQCHCVDVGRVIAMCAL